jgi:hypothetical protein
MRIAALRSICYFEARMALLTEFRSIGDLCFLHCG